MAVKGWKIWGRKANINYRIEVCKSNSVDRNYLFISDASKSENFLLVSCLAGVISSPRSAKDAAVQAVRDCFK